MPSLTSGNNMVDAMAEMVLKDLLQYHLAMPLRYRV